MRFTHGVAVLAAACAMTTIAAKAQMPGGGTAIMVKGGISNPAKAPMKDVGNNWWVVGLEYTLGNPEARTVNSLEGLYTSKSDTVRELGMQPVPSRYKVLSLMLNRKIRAVGKDGVAIGNVLFYGAGIGAHLVQVEVEDSNPGGVNLDRKSTVAGANLFIGYDMASNLQIEAKYQLGFSKVKGRDVSALQFLVGLKF